MKLFIKNMTNVACIIYVKNVLKKLGLHYANIELGQIEVIDDIDDKKLLKLNILLKEADLELIDNSETALVERIKLIIFELVKNDVSLKYTFSIYISHKLHRKYTYLSKIFLKLCGISIKKYFNQVKVDRVKKLIRDNELNLSEISRKMHYSSPSHLSHQFKQLTKITPLEFKHNQ